MKKRGRSVQWRYLKQRKVARVEQSATRDQGLCEERVGCACAPPIRPFPWVSFPRKRESIGRQFDESIVQAPLMRIPVTYTVESVSVARVGCACAPPIRPTGAPRFAEHTLQALSGGHDMPNKDFIDEGLAACIRVRLRFQG